MKKILTLILLFSLFSGAKIKGQVSQKDTPYVLEELFDRLVGNFNDNDRIRINDSIKMILDVYTHSDSVFTQKLTNLKYLGQIVSTDSLIKIVTWNLVLENQPGRYFCYFIRKQEGKKENKVYPLTTTYNTSEARTDTIFTQSDWYGALYYDIKPVVNAKDTAWVLLGIDYGNPDVSRKIIETMSFRHDGSIIFGKRWFNAGDSLAYRVVFEYASNAMMSLRFRSDKSIVFDHLVPFSQSKEGNHQFYGPDYSFDAYNFENGLWKLVINVDARNKE